MEKPTKAKKKEHRGFARSGKASTAGATGNLNRWGRRCWIKLEFIYLPGDEEKIATIGKLLYAKSATINLEPEYVVPSTIDCIVTETVMKAGALETLGVFLNQTWISPSRDGAFTPGEEKVMSLRGRTALLGDDGKILLTKSGEKLDYDDTAEVLLGSNLFDKILAKKIAQEDAKQ